MSVKRRLILPLAILGLVVACSARPEHSSTLATPSTTETGSSAPTNPVSPPASVQDDELAPIYGYGDFSGKRYSEIDWYEVTRLIVECANDYGMPVTLIPPGDGYSFAGIPMDQNAAAGRVVKACIAGLQIPPYESLTEDELAVRYEYLVDMKDCLTDEGYETSDAPTLDVFIEGWDIDAWNPYDDLVDSVGMTEWNRLNVACPQQ